jgi:hypothetical protein
MQGEVDGHLGFPTPVVADDDDDAFQSHLHSNPLEPVFSPATSRARADPAGRKNQKGFVKVYRWTVKQFAGIVAGLRFRLSSNHGINGLIIANRLTADRFTAVKA